VKKHGKIPGLEFGGSKIVGVFGNRFGQSRKPETGSKLSHFVSPKKGPTNSSSSKLINFDDDSELAVFDFLFYKFDYLYVTFTLIENLIFAFLVFILRCVQNLVATS
jgi:hypothetical protein